MWRPTGNASSSTQRRPVTTRRASSVTSSAGSMPRPASGRGGDPALARPHRLRGRCGAEAARADLRRRRAAEPVSVSHAVHLAVSRLRPDPDQAEQHLERALEELTSAHEELRELARGLHPQILTLQGLDPAVRSIARRAPIPVTVVTVRRAALAAARRECRVLRRLGSAHERAQVRAGNVRDHPRGAAQGPRPDRRGLRRRLRRRRAVRGLRPRRPP